MLFDAILGVMLRAIAEGRDNASALAAGRAFRELRRLKYPATVDPCSYFVNDLGWFEVAPENSPDRFHATTIIVSAFGPPPATDDNSTVH